MHFSLKYLVIRLHQFGLSGRLITFSAFIMFITYFNYCTDIWLLHWHLILPGRWIFQTSFEDWFMRLCSKIVTAKSFDNSSITIFSVLSKGFVMQLYSVEIQTELQFIQMLGMNLGSISLLNISIIWDHGSTLLAKDKKIIFHCFDTKKCVYSVGN